jgi:hypothetical protein
MRRRVQTRMGGVRYRTRERARRKGNTSEKGENKKKGDMGI